MSRALLGAVEPSKQVESIFLSFARFLSFTTTLYNPRNNTGRWVCA